GIRDKLVTGVQTCALPISSARPDPSRRKGLLFVLLVDLTTVRPPLSTFKATALLPDVRVSSPKVQRATMSIFSTCESCERISSRSEERRVGKECGCWWSPE